MTRSEINLCCLLRMDCPWERISTMMGVKESTIYRTLYRACEHMDKTRSKEAFKTFIRNY